MNKRHITKSIICLALVTIFTVMSFGKNNLTLYASDSYDEMIQLYDQTINSYTHEMSKYQLSVADIENLKKIQSDAAFILETYIDELDDDKINYLNNIVSSLTDKIAAIEETDKTINDLAEQAKTIPGVDNITESYYDQITAMKSTIRSLLVYNAKTMSEEQQNYLRSLNNTLDPLITRLNHIRNNVKPYIKSLLSRIPDIDLCTSEHAKKITSTKDYIEKTLNNYSGNLGTENDTSYIDELKNNITSLNEKQERINTVNNLLMEIKETSEKLPATDEIKVNNKTDVLTVKSQIEELLNKYSGNITEQEKLDVENNLNDIIKKLNKITELEEAQGKTDDDVITPAPDKDTEDDSAKNDSSKNDSSEKTENTEPSVAPSDIITTTPATGDNSVIYMWIIISLISGLGIISASHKFKYTK